MTEQTPTLPGSQAREVLESISTWGDLMTIVQHGGSVFEFKGPFPKGEMGHGYYNLIQDSAGFQGHLALDLIHEIGFQESLRGGRESYALVFSDAQNSVIFKTFLGRDAEGALLPHQVNAFHELKEQAHTLLSSTGTES